MTPEPAHCHRPSPVNISIREHHPFEVSEDAREQWTFETLLTVLSASFVNLPADQVDRAIETSQRQICEHLLIDHSSLWQNSHDEPGVYVMTHLYRNQGLPPIPDRMEGDSYFPWVLQKVSRKETVCSPRNADAPPEAAVDKKSWEAFGVKSTLVIPLWVGNDPIFGSLAFDATTQEREWPEGLVQRLQLVAQIFANALARKRTEQALVESELRLRMAAAAAGAGLWTIDPGSGRMWTTDETKAIFGVPSTEEFTLQRFLNLVHVEDRASVESIIEETFQCGEERSIEYRVNRSDGETRWIFSRGCLRAGDGCKLMGVSIDVTERKRREEVQCRHCAIIRSSEDAIIRLDLQGIISDWNAAAERIYGYSRKEAVGQNSSFNTAPEVRKQEEMILTRFGAGEDIQHCETVRVRKDATRVSVSLTSCPIRDRSGQIVGVTLIARDISETKRVWQELQNSYEEIRKLTERLQAESDYLQDEVRNIGRYDEIVGRSETLRQVLKKVEQVASTDSVVLITGESGTGKELIARAIHERSTRKNRVMVKVDCAALPATLIESELFGREKGAYTGALARQIGRFETADGSTVFLDEIGELGVELQAKLLRIVQDGDFERLGSAKTTHVNVRLIAATHRDLAQRVQSGSFREDLFYRLNVFPIHVPPLRERPEDIPLLVAAFLAEFEKKMGKKIHGVPRKMMDQLMRYPWPGNIRELRNVIERSVIVTTGERLHLEPPTMNVAQTHTLVQAEHQHIVSVLERTAWRIKGPKGAAAILGMKPSTLYTVMRRLRIPTRHERSA